MANWEHKYAVISASSSGANEIVPAVTGRKIRVIAAILMAAGAVNPKFQSGSTDITGLLYPAQNGGFVMPYNPQGWCETAAGAALNLNLSGAVAVGGCLLYQEI